MYKQLIKLSFITSTILFGLAFALPTSAYHGISDAWMPSVNSDNINWAQEVLRGRVINQETGLPVPGATVLQPGGPQGTRTDAKGRFWLKLSVNEYEETQVYVATGYWLNSDNNSEVTLTENELQEQKRQLYLDHRDCRIKALAAKAAGKVSKAKIRYTACMYHQTTDFVLYVVPSSNYPEAEDLTVHYSNNHLIHTGKVVIRVVDAATNEPVPEVAVISYGEKTDYQGKVYLDGLLPGTRNLYLGSNDLSFAEEGKYYRLSVAIGYTEKITIRVHDVSQSTSSE